MTHIGKDALLSYMNSDSDQENMIEDHLLECETCTNMYVTLIEDIEVNGELSDDFTDITLQQMEKILPSPPKANQNKVVTHYLVAAGLTIFLTLTGVFQGALNVTEIQQKQNTGLITEHLMTKTNDVLEGMKGVHHNE
ncbi:hypothetical protein SAMN04487943_104392 [Gracilibacillus orientalis]|uniref:Zinc-finger n=1 Tax=Gracilibacillus orientalis TaxID=334253 RepID=A0A1I4L6S6_9BACI|nr:hypothetical protein [Gracilibacillus orientalis]SFL86566.1 hypothetical protein SAMN04487943_104392 [Gracilibacillus orientalis]